MINRDSTEKKNVEIGHCERYVLGEPVIYSLFMSRDGERNGYRIGICRGEETAMDFVGEDFLSVVVLFTEIVRGEVFPYSLEEIIRDFRGHEKIYRDKSV